jgi:hypothetical protein
VPSRNCPFNRHIAVLYPLSISLLLFFLSCASVSPVDERPPVAVAVSVEAVQPEWQPFAREITGGLEYFEGRVSRPRLEFYALKVDLSDPGLKIVVAGGGIGPNSDGNAGDLPGGKAFSVKVSTFVSENNLLAGINALPFDVVSGVEGEPRTNIGVVIADGVMISPPTSNFDALVFYAADSADGDGSGGTSGAVAIIAQSEISTTENIENAVGGFRRILEKGEPVQRVTDLAARHPRSAAGICPERRFLYLVVIDGRRPGSVGATEEETALLLCALGAVEGLNFDGGGSSAMALRYTDGIVRTVNTPVHGGIPGRERAVAGCLGVAVNSE